MSERRKGWLARLDDRLLLREMWSLWAVVAAGFLIVVALLPIFIVRDIARDQQCADQGWDRVQTRGSVLCVDNDGVVHRP